MEQGIKGERYNYTDLQEHTTEVLKIESGEKRDVSFWISSWWEEIYKFGCKNTRNTFSLFVRLLYLLSSVFVWQYQWVWWGIYGRDRVCMDPFDPLNIRRALSLSLHLLLLSLPTQLTSKMRKSKNDREICSSIAGSVFGGLIFMRHTGNLFLQRRSINPAP